MAMISAIQKPKQSNR